ncbi:hypothetical protein DHB74_00375 [Pseudomonas sp. G11-1]|nr:hypothetical protein [Pseudomonas sp. G11-1]MCO5789091.1 hypothetical protein [Pseudomonas sp. G11-2]
MLNKILPKSSFAKNVLTLMTGTTIAQAIPIAITPVLTRMYTPEDFGVFALFVAIATIIGSVANGRYELAIMLPVEDDDALNIAAMGMLIATVLALMLVFPAVYFNNYLAAVLDNEFIAYWLYFVPLVVWLIGLYNVLNYLNNRKKAYMDMAKATVYKSVAQAMVQLGYGALKGTASGLISGQIASHIMANARLAMNVRNNYRIASVKWLSMRRVARRYIDFPKYSMWAVFANTLSVQLLNILITAYYSVATLGFYSLAQRILGMPTNLIGISIGQVYFQQATKEKNETGKAVKIFRATSKRLVVLSCAFFIPLYFLVPALFELAFGEQWQAAGIYAQIILPVFAVRFVSATLSNTNSIFERQKLSLIWQVAFLVLSMLCLFVCGYLDFSFEMFLRTYSIVITIHYLLLLALLKLVSEAKI